jgi:hypothetical protein
MVFARGNGPKACLVVLPEVLGCGKFCLSAVVVNYRTSFDNLRSQYFDQVGAAGIEPATSCSQSRRDNRTTLRPEVGTSTRIYATFLPQI